MVPSQNPKSNRHVWILTASSVPILLILLGLFIAAAWTSRTDPVSGVTDTTLENAIFFGGLYLALPCGLLNVAAGIHALSKGLLKKRAAASGILIGAIGILMGILAWSWMLLVSSFVF